MRSYFSWIIFVAASLLIPHTLNAQTATDYYQQSLKYYNSGETDKAVEEINKVLRTDPANVDALYLRAFYFLQAGKKADALHAYTILLKVDPTHEGALTNRALIFMEQQKYVDAMGDLNKRVALDENNWKALYDRAYCEGLMGDHRKAIADFSRVIALNPDYAEAWANRGYSKINELTNEGVIRPAPSQTGDACGDLKQALQMGDSTVVKMIKLYCE